MTSWVGQAIDARRRGAARFHLGAAAEQRERNGNAERAGGLEVERA
jgi:hypothetical protein